MNADYPSPGEPVQLLDGQTGFISSKLGAGEKEGWWRVIVKDPSRGNRRTFVYAGTGDFLWRERVP